jgi:hypothetical protein
MEWKVAEFARGNGSATDASHDHLCKGRRLEGLSHLP